jgi:hypothetical protein
MSHRRNYKRKKGPKILQEGWMRRFLSSPGFGSGPDLMSGADGALVVNGVFSSINAGDIKRYSSISIINNGVLQILGAQTLGLGVNNGTTPTIIGCSGNCTINTGGAIEIVENAASTENGAAGGVTFSAPVVPFDSVVNPIEYYAEYMYGGGGGEGHLFGGNDYVPTGGGGGGGSSSEGGNSYTSFWGYAGSGSDGSYAGVGGVGFSPADGFSANGTNGIGGEGPTGVSDGGGGGGGVRAISGGMLYLQVAGTLTVSGTVIYAQGGTGGNGGNGGISDSGDDDSYGGGGGGGGAGGNGGCITVRYKSGAFAAGNVFVVGGNGGIGGTGGIASGSFYTRDGLDGGSGVSGTNGVIDIATY